MTGWRAVLLTSGTLLLPAFAAAHGGTAPQAGSLVGVRLSIDGRPAALYPARDGSDRFYVEARAGAGYELRLVNRTGERLGAAVVVDGLDAISGERADVRSATSRMYVLGPWEQTLVRGWRTSLRDVSRFTFVDESVSYAVRSGQDNARLGWIEVAVFREREPIVRQLAPEPPAARDRARRGRDGVEEAEDAAAAPESAGRAEAKSRAQSHPGTGWGERAYDPVRLVRFTPAASPAEVVTLRYEYAGALRALGIRLGLRDRLAERERGEHGFARPPRP